jgi:hypothetical protein
MAACHQIVIKVSFEVPILLARSAAKVAAQKNHSGGNCYGKEACCGLGAGFVGCGYACYALGSTGGQFAAKLGGEPNL